MSLEFIKDPDRRPLDNRPNGHPGGSRGTPSAEITAELESSMLMREFSSLVMSSAEVVLFALATD